MPTRPVPDGVDDTVDDWAGDTGEIASAPPPGGAWSGVYPLTLTEAGIVPSTRGLPPEAAGALRGPVPPAVAVVTRIRRIVRLHTWQLLVASTVALVVGLWLGSLAGPSGTAAAPTSSYRPPPPAGSTPATTTPAAAATTATTVPASGSSTTTSSVPPGPATVLVGPTQRSGNWTSPAFTIAGGTWNIGWAFRCTPAPTAGPAFQVFVTPANATGAPTGTPAVNETGGSGQSVTAQTTAGAQQLVVQAPANCTWVVKVTGLG